MSRAAPGARRSWSEAAAGAEALIAFESAMAIDLAQYRPGKKRGGRSPLESEKGPKPLPPGPEGPKPPLSVVAAARAGVRCTGVIRRTAGAAAMVGALRSHAAQADRE